MDKPRFLFDECTDPDLIEALRRREPNVDIIRVNDSGAPPSGTPDPDLLLAAETLQRVLLTNDKRTMPGHLKDHYAAGHRTAGVMMLRPNISLARYMREILNHWATTSADDWIDRTVYIP